MNSVIVTLVLKMKEIVMLMMSVKMIFYVDQTIVQLHLVLPLRLIAAIIILTLFLEMMPFVILNIVVEKMKEIVILMMSVKMVLDVQPVQPILDSVQIYIVAHI